MFLLKERKLHRGCKGHIDAGLGCGADYYAHYVPLYAPFDTVIAKEYYGSDGGKWIWFNDKNGNSIQCAHMSEYKVNVGDKVKEGDIIGITGNSGTITTGPHLHVQIIDRNSHRVDPVLYFDNLLNPISMIIQRLSDAQKKHLQDLINGNVVLAFNTDNGKTYVIRDSHKKELPIDQILVNTLFVGVIDSDLNKIPNN